MSDSTPNPTPKPNANPFPNANPNLILTIKMKKENIHIYAPQFMFSSGGTLRIN